MPDGFCNIVIGGDGLIGASDRVEEDGWLEFRVDP